MSYSERDLISHIMLEIEYLLNFRPDNYKVFFKDETLQRAFVRSLEIIGEAVSKFPTEFKNIHSEINWRNISGMRNVLIHDYFGVDYEIVWDVVTNEIPELKLKLEEILKNDYDV